MLTHRISVAAAATAETALPTKARSAVGVGSPLRLLFLLLLSLPLVVSANFAAAPSLLAAVPASVRDLVAASKGIVVPCSFSTASGVRFDNLFRLRQFYSDYSWTGGADDGTPGGWSVGVNICRESASNPACRSQLGSVCITNLTSVASHAHNVTAATDLIVAGRVDLDPAAVWSLLDESDPSGGVQLAFRNSPFQDPWTSLIQLRCDPRFLSANISQVDLSLSDRTLVFQMAAFYACPTYVPPSPWRLQHWQIALIVIGSIIAAYITLGCMYNCMTKGRPGCPNKAFWTRLPNAIAHACTSACAYIGNGCKREAEVYTEL